MECKKLTAQEIDRWSELIADSYDTSPLHDRIVVHEWKTIYLAFVNAIEEDFDEMCESFFDNIPAYERLKNDPLLREFIMRMYEHGVACGHAGCCCNLANFYHDAPNDGSPEDYAIAIDLYELGKARGDAQSAINLGYMYYYGRGTNRNYARAYECYAFGALMANNPEGYWKLGDLYASGRGVRKSEFTAWRMYVNAYKHAGEPPLTARAAHHMADYLLHGIEGKLEPNPEAALSLYTEAELGYYTLIDDGLTYYSRQLEQAIEGQQAARIAVREHHRRIRAGEE